MREQRRRVNESYNYTSNGSDSDEYAGQQNGRHDQYEQNYSRPVQQRSQPMQQVSKPDRSRWNRYEMDPPSLVDRELDGRGRLVKFFRNGESLFPAVPVSINPKEIKDMGSLKDLLTRKIPLTNGVKYIFKISGQKIEKITDFQRGDECVVSSVNSFNNKIEYGGKRSAKNTSSPFNNSALALRNRHSRNYESGSEHTPTRSRMNDPFSKPVAVTIISNDDRKDRKDVILNPKTAQQFEQFLKDIGSMMTLHYPPATAMYSERDKTLQINSFSKLFKEVNSNNCNAFIMCGQERLPRKDSAAYSHEDEEQNQSEPEYEPEPTPKATPKRKGTKNSRRFNKEKEPPMTSRVQKPKPAPKQSSPRKPQRNEDQNEFSNQKKSTKPAPKSYRQEEEEDYRDISPPRKTNRDRYDEKPSRESLDERYNDYEPQQTHRDESKRSVPNSQKEGRHLDNENLYGRRQPKDKSPVRENPTQRGRNDPPRHQQNRSDRFDDDEEAPRKAPVRGKQSNKVEAKPEEKTRKVEEEKPTPKENGARDINKKGRNDNRYERENLNSSGNENDDEEEEEDDDDDNRPLSPITPRPRMARMDTPDY